MVPTTTSTMPVSIVLDLRMTHKSLENQVCNALWKVVRKKNKHIFYVQLYANFISTSEELN